MAINILTEPQNPPITGDYSKDQAIQQSCEIPDRSILTLWEDTASTPAAKQGAYIRHASNTFEVQSSDEAISGSLTSGINYIVATESAGVITLAWATSTTGYSFNQAQGGIYNGSGQQLLRDVCYVDGSDNIRGIVAGMDFNSFTLADGSYHIGDLTMSGYIYPVADSTVSSVTLGVGASFTVPRGIWLFTLRSDGEYTWQADAQSITIFSDGTRKIYSSALSLTFYYRRVG